MALYKNFYFEEYFLTIVIPAVLQLFIYWFLYVFIDFKDEGRGIETSIGCLLNAPYCGLSHNLDLCPVLESNQWPLMHEMMLN